MGIECAYSFDDLFEAAFGRKPSRLQMDELAKLSQEERNAMVTTWAQKANWEIKEKTGLDGQTYAAFAPSFGFDESSQKSVYC